MSDRYYVHGDIHELFENKFYCSICDSFEYQAHFTLSDHINNNFDQFRLTVNKFKAVNSKFLKLYYRPNNSYNLFSKLTLEKLNLSKFYRWLLQQNERLDMIGQLARDTLIDSEFPKESNSLSYIKTYLSWRGVHEEVLQALYEAFKEFNKKDINRENISLKLRFEVFRRDNYKCQICGTSVKDLNAKLEVDHKIPVAKGGMNDFSNLWTLCFKCNRGKKVSHL